jgi:hypothetical protein
MIFALVRFYPHYPDHLGAHGRVYVAWRAGDFPKKNPPRIYVRAGYLVRSSAL